VFEYFCIVLQPLISMSVIAIFCAFIERRSSSIWIPETCWSCIIAASKKNPFSSSVINSSSVLNQYSIPLCSARPLLVLGGRVVLEII